MENVSNHEVENEDIEGKMKQMTVLRTEYAQLKSQMGNIEETRSKPMMEVIEELPAITSERKSNFKEKLVTFFKIAKSNKGGRIKLDIVEREPGPSDPQAELLKESTHEESELKIAKDLINDLELKLESKNIEMSKISEENRKLLSENEQIQAKLEMKQSEDDLSSSYHFKIKEDEVEKLKVELDKKLKVIEQMEMEIDELKAENDKLKAQSRDLNSNVEERLAELETDNENLKQELNSAHEELGRIQKQMEQAVGELRHQREKSSLEGKISIIHNNNRALMSERVSVESENSSLKRQLEELLQQTHPTPSELDTNFEVEEECGGPKREDNNDVNDN